MAVLHSPGSGYSTMDVLSSEIKLKGHNGNTIRAHISKPSAPGTYPGIVQVHGVEGVDEHLKDVSRRLAVFGYVVITPSHWSLEEAAKGEPITIEAEEDLPIGRELGAKRTFQQVDGDLLGAYEYLKNYPGVNPERIGVMGFCSGGRFALNFACGTSLSCVVNCYSNGVLQPTEVNPEPVINRVKDLSCPMLGIFGKDDPNPTPEDVEVLRQELEKHGKTYEIVSYYNAGHAFFSDHRPGRWRPTAAHMAWGRILEWLDKYLTYA